MCFSLPLMLHGHILNHFLPSYFILKERLYFQKTKKIIRKNSANTPTAS